MQNRPQRMSFVIEEAFQKAVDEGLKNYLNTPVNERQEREKQGYNLNSYLYEALSPMLYNTRIKDILIIMEEGIGNMVMMTPALELLRKNNPRVNVTVLCKPAAGAVIKGWDVVDRVIHELDEATYDLCVSTIWGKQTTQANSEKIQEKCKSNFDVQFRPKVSEHVQHLAIAEFLDSIGPIPLPHCQESTGEELQELLTKMGEANLLNIEGDNKDAKVDVKPYIVVGNTTLRNHGWDRKRWPYYKELTEMINKKFGTPILLVGDDKDKADFEKVDWPENVSLEFSGSINIPQLASLIKMSEYYVGNDTGPTHIAAAVGAKTYAIFGPTLLSKNKPIGKDVTIINKHMWCSPCQYTEQWEECEDYNCMNQITADIVYNKIYHSADNKPKKRLLLVGDTSPGHYRVEHGIKRILEKEMGFKVYNYEYRKHMAKTNPVDGTFGIVNEVLNKGIDYVLICGGNGLVSPIFTYCKYLAPETKIFNWYTDQRGGLEPWWVELGKHIDESFWTTGAGQYRTEFFAATGKDYTFLPSAPDEEYYFPIECEKEYDVLFVGTPHSPERISLLQEIATIPDIKLKIIGDGEWPEDLKKCTSKGIFGEELNKEFNKAKIIVNTNMFNEIPLYFSDRYFHGLATKVCTVNQHIHQIDEMFSIGEDMVLFKDNEDAKVKIEALLKDDEKRNKIAESGYNTYKKSYTLSKLLKRMFDGK